MPKEASKKEETIKESGGSASKLLAAIGSSSSNQIAWIPGGPFTRVDRGRVELLRARARYAAITLFLRSRGVVVTPAEPDKIGGGSKRKLSSSEKRSTELTAHSGRM